MRWVHAGIALVEALIALIIAAVGLVAVVRLHIDFVQAGAYGKARSEAINLAEQKIEQLRSLSRTGAGIEGSSAAMQEKASSTAAEFSRTWEVATGEWPVSLSVSVAWDGPHGELEEVRLATVLDRPDPYELRTVVGGSRTGALNPAGALRAKGVNRRYLPDEIDDLLRKPGVSDNGDGTLSYRTATGQIELIDRASGEVLLVIGPSSDPVTIAGRVYFSAAVDQDRVRLLASGGAYCTQGPVEPANPYSYFTYACHMGEGWYGNVGLVFALADGCGVSRNESAGACESPGYDACVGDPFAVTEQRSRSRSYRGFMRKAGVISMETDTTSAPFLEATGLLVRSSDEAGDAAALDNISSLAGRHNFLVVSTAEDCMSAMVSDPEAPSNPFDANLPAEVCLKARPTDLCPHDDAENRLSGRYRGHYGLAHWYGFRAAVAAKPTGGVLCRSNAVAYLCSMAGDGPWGGVVSTCAAPRPDGRCGRGDVICEPQWETGASPVAAFDDVIPVLAGPRVRDLHVATAAERCPSVRPKP